MNIFNRKDRISAQTKKCECHSITECPYNTEKDCNFNKENCHLIENKKRKKKQNNTHLRVITFISLGLLFYVLSSVFSNDDNCKFTHSEYLYNIISGISISIIAGSLLSFVIDLPSRLKEYEESFINALASNNYLKSLDENRLTKLRNDITEQLHKANAPCMAKGLINIDQRICELLRKPYYAKYRQFVICTPIKDSEFIEKEHIINYTLINPYSVNRDATEFISIKNLILLKSNEKAKENAIKDIKITCSIDGKETKDYSNDIKLVFSTINSKVNFYDTQVCIDAKEEKNTDIKKGIRIDFKDHIEVHMQYKIQVHKDDICFTKRLQHPVKNFRLDYSYKKDGVKLFGQIFGTEMQQSDISIQYLSDNAISLETFDWLLPTNGAIVVMLNI
ncbi:MAG: hypothetical protein J6C22_01140 [Bacteroides sp.]|nr:hypothetical protein [Bacteroides sp.]